MTPSSSQGHRCKRRLAWLEVPCYCFAVAPLSNLSSPLVTEAERLAALSRYAALDFPATSCKACDCQVKTCDHHKGTRAVEGEAEQIASLQQCSVCAVVFVYVRLLSPSLCPSVAREGRRIYYSQRPCSICAHASPGRSLRGRPRGRGQGQQASEGLEWRR